MNGGPQWRPRSTTAAVVAVAAALVVVLGAEWSVVTGRFPFGSFEVRAHAFGVVVAPRGSDSLVRVQPCFESVALAPAPNTAVAVCEAGAWPRRAESPPWLEAWAALDGALGRPRVSWQAAEGRAIRITARPDAIAIRFEKVVSGLGPGVAHYAHAFALADAHIVYDDRRIAYTRLDDAALLARLGLHRDEDADPWRGLPTGVRYVAIHDPVSGRTLYLLGQADSRLRIDRRRNLVLRQQTLTPRSGAPLEVDIRLHAVLPAGLAP